MAVDVTLDIGDLFNRITIEQRTLSEPDANGVKAATWTTFATVWANITLISQPSEQFIAKSFASKANRKVVMHYLPGIDTTMRVNFGGRIFNIAGIDNVQERKIKHVLYVSEVTL
jgi:SPP1 family predicted phage head-tail adaptor